jgi:hypothetical protein
MSGEAILRYPGNRPEILHEAESPALRRALVTCGAHALHMGFLM